MARLIDADKYCEFLNTYPLEKAQENIMTFYRDALRHTFECEVEAISIEWLKEYEVKNGQEVRLQSAIEEWEKENANNETE